MLIRVLKTTYLGRRSPVVILWLNQYLWDSITVPYCLLYSSTSLPLCLSLHKKCRQLIHQGWHCSSVRTPRGGKRKHPWSAVASLTNLINACRHFNSLDISKNIVCSIFISDSCLRKSQNKKSQGCLIVNKIWELPWSNYLLLGKECNESMSSW